MQRRCISVLTVALTAVALILSCSLTVHAAPPGVTWTPGEVRQTLGDGAGITTDSTISLVSATTLNDVELWVVPALRPFVSVFPDRIPSLQAGVPVAVKIHYSIPPRAFEGTYEGTVHVRVRSKTVPATLKMAITLDYGDNVISEATHVFGEGIARSLMAIGETALTFASPTAELLALRPGDVIAFGITSRTPVGLLRRVVGTSLVGSQLVVETEQGSLEDVIDKGTVSISQRVSPPNVASMVAMGAGVALRSAVVPGVGEGFTVDVDETFDADNDPRTAGDQIKVSGRVSIDPRFTLDLVWDGGLQRAAFANTTTATGELNVLVGTTLLELEPKKWEVLRSQATPLVVWISWFPLVIQPVITGNVGVEGEVTAGITTGISPQVTATAGVVYDHGSVEWVSGLDAAFNPTEPRLSAGCDIKGFIGPQLMVLLQGVAGPYVEARVYGELEADLFDDPWWRLFGGVAVGTGLRVEILGRRLADYYEPDLIDYRRLLLQATGPSPVQGSVQGSVRDAVTRAALPGVGVRALQGGSLVGSATTDPAGTYRIALPAGEDYVVEFTKEAYLPVEHHGVTVAPGRATYLEAVLQIDAIHSGPGDVGGKVVSALNGAGVGGLSVDLRAGLNVRAGTVVASTVTRSDGTYAFNGLPAGNYTAQAGGAGWLTAYFTVVCVGGMSTGDQNGTVTPVLAAGETRIILTWGALPTDLDSHFTGPLPSGTRFHMYYPLAGSESPWPTIVTLDHDDVTSYGPETTTLLSQIDGVYRFSVHDFSNRMSTASTALSNSNASVRVYRGSSLVAVFNVPPGQAGTLWAVFEMSGTTITPVNTLSFASDPDLVLSAARGVAAPTATGTGEWLPGPLPAKR